MDLSYFTDDFLEAIYDAVHDNPGKILVGSFYNSDSENPSGCPVSIAASKITKLPINSFFNSSTSLSWWKAAPNDQRGVFPAINKEFWAHYDEWARNNRYARISRDGTAYLSADGRIALLKLITDEQNKREATK